MEDECGQGSTDAGIGPAVSHDGEAYALVKGFGCVEVDWPNVCNWIPAVELWESST